MVYTISLRNLSFKMNLSDMTTMLTNQEATYAILRYAKDIPDSVYSLAMQELILNFDEIHYPKLLKIVKAYKSVTSVGIQMSDELVGSIIVEDGIARYEEDGEVIWSRNVEPSILVTGESASKRFLSFDDEDDDDDGWIN